MFFIENLTLKGNAKITRQSIQDIDGYLSHEITFDMNVDKKTIKITNSVVNFCKLTAENSSDYDIV